MIALDKEKNGIPLDDGRGGASNLMAYVDDLNVVIPYEDCLFFCD